MIGINVEIQQFREELVNVVNKYDLPVEVKRMVVNGINLDLNMAVEAAVQEELIALQIEQQKEKEQEEVE